MQRITTPLGYRKGARGSAGLTLTEDIPHDYRRRIGAWVREHRIAKGLTQRELAPLVGEHLGNTAISAIETGHTSIAPERYASYADALGIPRKEFGLFMLRHTDPWVYALIFGAREKSLREDLAKLPSRARVGIGSIPESDEGHE